MPRFPEGSYLKGFLLEKCDKPLEEIERAQKAAGGNKRRPTNKKPFRKNFNKKPVNGNR
jgi:hypothetical protein